MEIYVVRVGEEHEDSLRESTTRSWNSMASDLIVVDENIVVRFAIPVKCRGHDNNSKTISGYWFAFCSASLITQTYALLWP